jgi:hypothetical protein
LATSRVTTALHAGSPLPVALTHGFAGAFAAAGILCGVGVALALVLLPRSRRNAGAAEAAAVSSSRCPGSPNCGHLARATAVGRERSAQA